MAPGTRRANRAGYAEHDDFEGLPVRQWREEWVKIAPPPPPETAKPNDIWAIELPHGLPKDAPLLAPHSQELLRAARSGRLYKRPPPAEEEEPEGDGPSTEKLDKKEDDDASTKGFTVRTWKPIARNAEGPDVSHLAKRRKGVVTIASKTIVTPAHGNVITKATVRRVDAAGNPYMQEVTVVEGQRIEGEIISTSVIAAPVTIAGGDAQQTPAKRRPPPPKRKPKGPGRGRRKKLPLPSSTRTSSGGLADLAEGSSLGEGENPIKQERDGEGNRDSKTDSAAPSEDEDDGDDGDEGDEGEEGEGNEDGKDSTDQQDQDQDMTDVPAISDTPAPAKNADSPEATSKPADSTLTNPPHLTTPFLPIPPLGSPKVEGSPLKNVMVMSPTEPIARSPAETAGLVPPAPADTAQIDTVMTEDVPPIAEPAGATPPVKEEVSEPTPKSVAEDAAPSLTNDQQPNENADTVMGDADVSTNVPEPPVDTTAIVEETEESAATKEPSPTAQLQTTPPPPAVESNAVSEDASDRAPADPEPAANAEAAEAPSVEEASTEQRKATPEAKEPTPEPQPAVDADDGPDLLDSLVENLDKRAEAIRTQSSELPPVQEPPEEPPAETTLPKEPTPPAAEEAQVDDPVVAKKPEEEVVVAKPEEAAVEPKVEASPSQDAQPEEKPAQEDASKEEEENKPAVVDAQAVADDAKVEEPKLESEEPKKEEVDDASAPLS